jgi:hypothetical protein
MTGAYDGPQVVGMDLHRYRSVLVPMTPDGRKLETTRITSSPAELRRVIARAGKRPRVVLGATYGWYWAPGTLTAAGPQVHLARPLGVKGIQLPAGQERRERRRRSGGSAADGTAAGGMDRPRGVRELRELAGTASRWSGCARAAKTGSMPFWPSSGCRSPAVTSSGWVAAPGWMAWSSRSRMRGKWPRCAPSPVS